MPPYRSLSIGTFYFAQIGTSHFAATPSNRESLRQLLLQLGGERREDGKVGQHPVPPVLAQKLQSLRLCSSPMRNRTFERSFTLRGELHGFAPNVFALSYANESPLHEVTEIPGHSSSVRASVFRKLGYSGTLQ